MVADNFTQAFIIFERMNDRGIDLTEADKIETFSTLFKYCQSRSRSV